MDMQAMMESMLYSMNELKKEVQELKSENEELRLNLVSINPIYSEEERTMAAQKLMEIQTRKQGYENVTLNSFFK